MIVEDLYEILASIEPQQIIDLSVCKGGIHAKSGGSMVVDFSCTGSFRIEFGLILQTLENCFEAGIGNEGNLELVLPTMEFHKEILLGHVNPHHFMVYTIFKLLVPGHFTVESLEAVQAEVLSSLTITVAVHE